MDLIDNGADAPDGPRTTGGAHPDAGTGSPESLAAGTRRLLATIDRLGDGELARPSRLPGWGRRHVLAHLANNAEAMGRLATWAATGVETPMYASAQQRAADIEAAAQAPAGRLRDRVRATAERLQEQLGGLPPAAWSRPVVTSSGRAVAATELPWLREREVWIHALDLDADISAADLPEAFARRLVDELVAWRSDHEGPRLELRDGESTWTVEGDGAVQVVELPLGELAAWLAGRPTRPGLPELPAWL